MARLARFVAFATAFLAPVAAVAAPPTPEQHLGRPVGTDFELAGYSTITAYMERLAKASPRVQVETVGKTTEGRDFKIVVISSEDNLARLPELKGYARQISDPRGLSDAERKRALDQGKVFFFISNNMHSTEIASPEMSMELAYRLATSDEEPYPSARHEIVLIMTPSTNPDGLDRVVDWYDQIKGTPYESARLPELYQWYAGHDNNRDWFMASLVETRIVTRLLYTEWFPQVYWDVHQQGSSSDRLFFPPFRDPLNPNLDPTVITGMGAIGARVLLDLTRDGLTGVSTGVKYDMWWNGGNRNVPVRHNMMGFLSEAASANLASPIYVPPRSIRDLRELVQDNGSSNRMPAPWRGGWWRIGDIVNYELKVARSLLGSVVREPRHWRELVMEAATRASTAGLTEAPHAWLIPPDNRDRGAVHRLLDTLVLEGIEIEMATETFTADDLEYPAGTLVLRRAQPYGRFLKDLFEIQRYPSGLSPYDVAGWTLPILMGVHRVEVARSFEAKTQPVKTADAALDGLGTPEREPYPWPHLAGDDSSSLKAVVKLLEQGISVLFDGDPESPAGGAWLVPAVRLAGAKRVLRGLDLHMLPGRKRGSERTRARGTARRAPGMVEVEELPRVALYAPWSANMDEGWIRWVFDEFELPYTRVRNETVRAGNLGDRFDVIVLPSVSPEMLHEGRPEGSVFPRFAGGLNPEGSLALHAFVNGGGTLVAIDRAGGYASELFDLQLKDATAPGETPPDEAFSCPGSVLRTLPDPQSPFAAGLPASQPVFFSRSKAWRLPKVHEDGPDEPARPALESVLRFPTARTLLSGWIRAPEQIAGASAWIRAKVGRGQVHVLGIRPTYRSWTQASFVLLFRAMLLPPDVKMVGAPPESTRRARRRARRNGTPAPG